MMGIGLSIKTEVFDFGPTNCTSANQYKYGLDNLNQYMEETGVANKENFAGELKHILWGV